MSAEWMFKLDQIKHLREDIELVELGRFFLDAEWIPIRRLDHILSSRILVKDFRPLQGQ
jgi:hypothetical protein